MPPLDNKQNTYDNVTNENDVIVRKEDLVPLNDPNCEHKFKKDEDDLEGYTAWTCINCGRGALLPEGTNII